MVKYILAFIPSLTLATGSPPPKPAPAPTQTQGQHQVQGQHQGQGQHQTAVGGAGGQGGNAQGGAGGNAQASNAGVDQAVNFDDRLQAPSQGIPGVLPTVPCATGWSGGLSVPGGSLGGSKVKIDPACEIRENIRLALAVNPALGLKAICRLPGLIEVATPADCVYVPPPAPSVAPSAVVNVPPPAPACTKALKQCVRK